MKIISTPIKKKYTQYFSEQGILSFAFLLFCNHGRNDKPQNKIAMKIINQFEWSS